MNWDWDKLQEKRQRHSKTPPQGQNTSNGAPPQAPFNDFFLRFTNKGFPWRWLIIAVCLLWAASGIFIVDPSQEGLVLRFGKFNRSVVPGPHYHIPYPFERAILTEVSKVQRVEVGTASSTITNKMLPSGRANMDESAMLTGDENIVHVQFSVQYQISDAKAYRLRIDQPDATVRSAAEAAVREVIGNTNIDAAITDGKLLIQDKARTLLQQILDSYESGIKVLGLQLLDVYPPREVSEAFKDVASARENMNRIVNEAETYRNDIIPKARGRAVEIVNQAEAYKQSVILQAQGESKRFLTMLEEVRKAPAITKRRLYIETMESVLANTDMEKLILPKGGAERTLPLLPIMPQTGGGRP